LALRKQFHSRKNPQNNGSPEGNPIEKPFEKEHDECDFAPYMDILPDGSPQRK